MMLTELWTAIGWAYVLITSTTALCVALRCLHWIRVMLDQAWHYNPPEQWSTLARPPDAPPVNPLGNLPRNPWIRTVGKAALVGLALLSCTGTATSERSTVDRGARVYLGSADGVSPTPVAYGDQRCDMVSRCGVSSLCCYDRHYNVLCVIRP